MALLVISLDETTRTGFAPPRARPKRFNRRLRRVFYLAALSSLRTGGPSRQFYDHKRGECLVHSQALHALARRLVDVLWALLRDGREFTLDTPAALAAAQRGRGRLKPPGVELRLHDCAILVIDEICCGSVILADSFGELGPAVQHTGTIVGGVRGGQHLLAHESL